MKNLSGLVLSGGLSSRMGRDKGSVIYPPSQVSQRVRCVELLRPFCDAVFVSCREEQKTSNRAGTGLDFADSVKGGGPGVGILSAAAAYPGQPLAVLACDFPFATEEEVAFLFAQRSGAHDVTCYASAGRLH